MSSYVTPKNAVYEIEVFRGNLVSAEVFGIKQRSQRERTDTTAWSEIPVETIWIDAQGREAQDGDVYQRKVSEAADGTITVLSEWEYVAPVLTLKDRYERVAPNRSRDNAPGSPIRNPLGLPLFDEGGLILRPAIGEQDIDEWTGEPLVDENGDPVLVV